MRLFKIKLVNKIVSVVLLAATILSVVNWKTLSVFAYEEKTGMICRNDGELTITRVEPTDESEKVSGLVYGKPVTVIDEVMVGEELWYLVKYTLKSNGTEKVGYCRAEHVLLDENATVFAKASVIADNVYVRNDAGTTGTYMLVALNKGHSLELLTQTTADGENWYRVRCVVDDVVYIGWVAARYVTISEYVIEEDIEFEDHLREIGFPESYINSLMMLHTKYPEWQFVPILTGLQWEDAVKAESAAGVNLVPTSSDDAKKSVASTEYDWLLNKWVLRDGVTYANGWVTAHPDYIAYCMDPRNYLTENNIFAFESLSYASTHTAEGVIAILDGTFMIGDETGIVLHTSDNTSINYIETFLEIAQKNNVSAYHLASRIRQEQGVSGGSSLISGIYPGYEGYYNYFNIGAYGTGDTLIIRGLTRAMTEGWNTRYLSLDGGAAFIAKNYISVGQDTLYFQKFNVVYLDKLYRHQYMTNVTAAITEGKKMGDAYTNKNQAFTFEIPVYENMPEEPVSFTTTGNRNNYLGSLDVSGLDLTPSFSGATTNYGLIVDFETDSVTVNGKAVVGASKVTGNGTYNLEVGTNVITVKCESQTGDEKTYTITIVREEKKEEPVEPEPPEETYSFATDVYQMGEYITGVQPGITAEDFLKGFSIENCVLELLNPDGTENTGIVGTGNTLELYFKEELVFSTEIIVFGDVNGDGKIRMTDMAMINRHMLGLSELSGAYLQAADVNHDEKVRMTDMAVINRHMLGLTTIEQTIGE